MYVGLRRTLQQLHVIVRSQSAPTEEGRFQIQF